MRENDVKYGKMAKLVQTVVSLKNEIQVILSKNKHILKWGSKNRFFYEIIY